MMSRQPMIGRGGDPVRRFILRILARLEREAGRAAQSVLREVLDAPDARGLDDRDRGFITECAYGVLRWRLRLDAILSRFVSRGLPEDPEVLNVLRLGVLQLLILDKVPPHAAVHESVELAKAVRGESLARFVNGVLRNIERNRETTATPRDLAERWAHPAWLVVRWAREMGDPVALEARLEANMRPPPVTLRLNPRTATLSVPGGRPSGVPGVIIAEGDTGDIRAGTARGDWVPQDAASARVVRMLDVQPGDHVLELCAGRGVKSSQIAETLGSGRLVSLDLSAAKLASAARLGRRWAPGVEVRFAAADASVALPFDPETRFDRILVDAPCTGLGVIRRRPETLWRRQPGDIVTLAALQAKILAEAFRWLRPGGTLVYAVCTTTAEETEAIVAPYRVLERVVTSPERDEMDGFFIASLRGST